jgi:hypothetical protein
LVAGAVATFTPPVAPSPVFVTVRVRVEEVLPVALTLPKFSALGLATSAGVPGTRAYRFMVGPPVPTVTATARVPAAAVVPGVQLTVKVQLCGAAIVAAANVVTDPPANLHVPLPAVVGVVNSPAPGVTTPVRPGILGYVIAVAAVGTVYEAPVAL